MSNEPPLNLYSAYASRFPGVQALLLTTADGRTYTYGDAERYSAKIANYLVGLGLKPGDRVTVQVKKSPYSLWLFLGTLRAGLVYHPLNTAYTDEELRFFLGDAGSSLFVCDPGRFEDARQLCSQEGVEFCRTLDADGQGSLSEEAQDCAREFDTVMTRADDVASLVYSSGTTGRPKGVMLTHNNLVSNASTLVDLWGFSRNDCLLHALPIFHVHGLFVATGCVLMSGASMRWLPAFERAAVLEQIPHSTAMMGVPTYYTRLLAEPVLSADLCASMRLFISGSAPLLSETFSAFEQRTGHRILERYGMTETGMNASNPLHGERRPGTVGQPLPRVEARVCDADHRELAAGEIGDLLVRGPNVFAGYWNMPEKTAEEFTAEGFFLTGDKASISPDGYVSIVGRSKDMVISGGLNIYPKEVELLVDAIPGVLESAVIGLPHADFGECVAAVVVCDGSAEIDEELVRGAVRAQAAAFKVPRQVYFADSLPRNAMGKVRKDQLRKSYSQVQSVD